MKQQKTTLAKSIDINGKKKAYDAACKKVLAEKGTVTYDIQFRVLLPKAEDVVQMIINVEAQNDFIRDIPC